MNPMEEKNLEKVRMTYEQAILQRRDTIAVLTDAIKQTITVASDTNWVKLFGNFDSLVGTGGLLAGLFLAPFTSGMSLLYFSIPGGAFSCFGSVTAVAASVVNLLKENQFLQLAKCALQKDKDTMAKHKETIEDIMTENGSAKQMKQWATNLKDVPNAFLVLTACKGFWGYRTGACANTTAVSDVVQSAKIAGHISDATGSSTLVEVSKEIVSANQVIETGIQAATDQTSLRALVGTDTVMAMSKSTLKITLPLAIASMSLDIYSFIQTAIDMKTGNTSLACGKLKQMCKLLEVELKIMEEEFKQFQ